MFNRAILIVTFLFSAVLSSAQNKRLIDSLERMLPQGDDLKKVTLFVALAEEYRYYDFSKSKNYCNQALQIATDLNSDTLIANANRQMGAIFNQSGDYERAVQYLIAALSVYEKHKINPGIAMTKLGLGLSYQNLKKYDEALKYYFEALAIQEKVAGGKKILANLYNNIAIIYKFKNDPNLSLDYNFKALKIREDAGDKRGVSYSYNNIGVIYEDLKMPKKALEYHYKSLEMKKANKDLKGMASSHINIASNLRKSGKNAEAEQNIVAAIKYAEQIGAKDFMLDAYEEAANIYKAMGKFESSTTFLSKFVELKDSLFTEKNNKLVEELKVKYESEKKEGEIELLKQNKKLSDDQLAESNKRNTLLILLGLALAAMAVFAYSRYRIKQRTNEKLEVANTQLQHLNELVNNRKLEIEKQSKEIQLKNKDITDSIIYAKRIQSAIMPPLNELYQTFPNSFVYYSPRDIVSGDFYWYSSSGETMLIACADCTGHGVPGAFMSMICVQILNLVVKNSNVTAPEQALQLLDYGVRKALRQSGADNDTTDGMDVALCAIHLEKGLIQYSGAYRPLYIIRDNNLLEFTANKFSIGGHKQIEKKFTGHEIKFLKGDKVYMFTDGYADQFGGPDGKKYKIKNFKKMLSSISHLPMAEQNKKIEAELKNWKGEHEQLDDILVIGFEVN
jgi:serine phosphatase RsbU (regulator of sigma subunit)